MQEARFSTEMRDFRGAEDLAQKTNSGSVPFCHVAPTARSRLTQHRPSSHNLRYLRPKTTPKTHSRPCPRGSVPCHYLQRRPPTPSESKGRSLPREAPLISRRENRSARRITPRHPTTAQASPLPAQTIASDPRPPSKGGSHILPKTRYPRVQARRRGDPLHRAVSAVAVRSNAPTHGAGQARPCLIRQRASLGEARDNCRPSHSPPGRPSPCAEYGVPGLHEVPGGAQKRKPRPRWSRWSRGLALATVSRRGEESFHELWWGPRMRFRGGQSSLVPSQLYPRPGADTPHRPGETRGVRRPRGMTRRRKRHARPPTHGVSESIRRRTRIETRGGLAAVPERRPVLLGTFRPRPSPFRMQGGNPVVISLCFFWSPATLMLPPAGSRSRVGPSAGGACVGVFGVPPGRGES